MPRLPWHLSRACVALLAVLISAIGGFRVAVDRVGEHHPAAMVATCALATDADRSQPAALVWCAPRAASLATTEVEPSAGPRSQVIDRPAPTPRCGAAGGPRAP